MLSTVSRAAIRRVTGGSTGRAQRVIVNNLARIDGAQPRIGGRALPILTLSTRSYASAAAKPAKTATTAAASAGTKTGKTASKAGRPKGTTTTKKAKAAPKAKKPKKKAAPVVKKKKVLTDEQKARLQVRKDKAKIKELKSLILVPPKRGPDTAWMVLMTETMRGNTGSGSSAKETLTASMRESSEKFKSMDAQTREQYNHKANENKLKHEAEYKAWLESKTPQEIYNSNRAVTRLEDLGVKVTHHHKIQDPRVPKRANAYALFTADRFHSGDFKGVAVSESGKLIAKEYKDLTESERQALLDRAKEYNENTYSKEMVKLFGTAKPVEKSFSL